MKTRLIRPAAIALLVVAVALPIGAADSAKSLYNKGKDAEARQNYEAAFDFYKQAYEQKPRDLAYRTSYERTRFLAAASHVHRGQLLRDAGKLDEAMAEFRKAAEIDSASSIAQQELRRTQKMIDAAGAAPPPQSAAPPRTGLQKRLDEAQGPVELAAISNVPITLKLTEDTKVIYDTVGKLAGINVLFDPDYTSRRIRIELNGVPGLQRPKRTGQQGRAGVTKLHIPTMTGKPNTKFAGSMGLLDWQITHDEERNIL